MTRPWMPFYIADYLADTNHLSTAEHGAYILLIMHYWVKGGLPKNEEAIRRITRMTPRQWAQSGNTLASLFLPEWRHGRCDKELAKAKKLGQIKSANAHRGHLTRQASKVAFSRPSKVPNISANQLELLMPQLHSEVQLHTQSQSHIAPLLSSRPHSVEALDATDKKQPAPSWKSPSAELVKLEKMKRR
jgi:uncharacterized protein YdaU (DUF1376 family)